ncbi:hypothetical protein MRS44_018221 [Fusarium solani]|uniref:uncharacterized protein n=1 Tax=Fusarium solani TaxID=169388 RepID=UPI0032C40537|nr:hypothetical protein MRS44_018221 [Fusarium solani]
MMAKPWNEHRATITNLYIQEGRTLEEVRGIMKTKYSFEASTWGIGKYNKKKCHQRRQQSLRATPPPPSLSLPARRSTSETSDPGSWQGSSCASLLSVGQLPFPPSQAPQHVRSRYFDAHQFPVPQSPSLPETRIKIEGKGVGTSCKDVFMYPSAARHPPQSVLQSCVPPHLPQVLKRLPVDKRNAPSRRDLRYAYADSAHLPVQQATPPQPPPCSMPPRSHCLHDYCPPLPSYMPGFSCRGKVQSGLRAPNMPVVRGMEIIGP